MNVAIIVAAGSGTRFGGERPKQFLEIAGKPLLIYTIEQFEACPEIDEIILVLAAEEIKHFNRNVQNYDFRKLKKTVSGGKTRAESVFNGLRAVDEETKIVAVHDGARPLVTIDEISQTIIKAQETGAACLVGKVTDTIKEIAEGKIVGTIDRKSLRRALTPQTFRFAVLREAFEKSETGEEVTDESYLVEKLGVEIAFVEGSPKNIKVTTPEDLLLAERLLKQAEIENV